VLEWNTIDSKVLRAELDIDGLHCMLYTSVLTWCGAVGLLALFVDIRV
jgi:hypothetical protein